MVSEFPARQGDHSPSFVRYTAVDFRRNDHFDLTNPFTSIIVIHHDLQFLCKRCNSLTNRRNRFASMLLRPLLTAVLCCVVAFGHAPAWLHVATCGKASGVGGDGCVSNSGGHCGCKRANPFADRAVSMQTIAQQLAGDRQASQSVYGSESSPVSERPIGEHSSDDCLICHSLMSAVGQIDLGLDVCVIEHSFFLTKVASRERLSDGVSRALHLRGPPLFLHTSS